MRLFQPAPAEEKPLRQVALSLPEVGIGQVLLRVRACGVCHTDLHTVEGEIHPPALPITPGHQVVGEVVATGRGVEKVVKGTRVGVPWLYSACGSCEYCRRGQENLCPSARFTGFHTDGGFAEYMLADEAYVLPLPAALDDIQAAPLLCAGIIGYRSLKRAEVQPGDRVGLFGFGASAHLALQVARHWGCAGYVFTRSMQHRQLAEELGAVWVGNVNDQTPDLLDRAILFAPAGTLVPVALERLRAGGTLAINAIYMSAIPEMPYALLYGERTLRSVANATRQDGVEFLKLASEIPIQATTRVYPFEEANQALSDLKHSRIQGEAVLQIAI